MNKVLTLIAGLSFAAMATTIMPSSVASEKSLQQILDGITVDGTSSVDVNTDQIVEDAFWRTTANGNSTATMIIEFAGNAAKNQIGIYDAATGSEAIIFTGTSNEKDRAYISFLGAGVVNVAIKDYVIDENGIAGLTTVSEKNYVNFTSNNFGFFLANTTDPTLKFFSDDKKNADGQDHMLAFQGTNDQVLLPGTNGGTWTPNEFIYAWEDVSFAQDADWDYNDLVMMVESVEVPEPATVSLFAFGLVAMLGSGWMRRKKS